jgi:uncharacterized membrane protein
MGSQLHGSRKIQFIHTQVITLVGCKMDGYGIVLGRQCSLLRIHLVVHPALHEHLVRLAHHANQDHLALVVSHVHHAHPVLVLGLN